MTILFLSIEFNYCCGISRSIFSLATALRRKGHRLILGVPGGTLVTEWVQCGMEYVYVPVRPDEKNASDFAKSVRVIRKTIKKYRVDVVHSHHRLAEFYAVLAAMFTGVPLFATAHALIKGKKWLSFRSHMIFAVSQAVVHMLTTDFNIPAQRIRLVRNIPRSLRMPNAIELEAFRRQHQLSGSDFVIAGIGRLHREKGFDVLLQAIQQLKQLRLIVLIAGKGAERLPLQTYASEHHLPVQFVDEINEVALIYASANIIVVPSREESAGLVAIEAARFARPVVATNVGGLTETIINNVTGLVVAPEQPAALAQAIEKLYRQKAEAEKLGHALQALVEKEYDSNHIAGAVQQLYQQALKQRSKK